MVLHKEGSEQQSSRSECHSACPCDETGEAFLQEPQAWNKIFNLIYSKGTPKQLLTMPTNFN